jgi:hypothetical protein
MDKPTLGFFSAYIEAALWSSHDNEEPLDSKFGKEDIDPGTLTNMEEDCAEFMRRNEKDLEEWGDDTQAGHDFWLTRNCHGVGFWDRGRSQLGERLAKEAKRFGEFNLYVGKDGKVHGY